MNVYAVLMAGGVGTRFWPRSREKSPKQVLSVTGKETLIQATYKRLNNLVDDSRILVVTNYATAAAFLGKFYFGTLWQKYRSLYRSGGHSGGLPGPR